MAASRRNTPISRACSRRCRCRSTSFPATTMRASLCVRRFADAWLFPGGWLPAVHGRRPACSPDRARHAGRGQGAWRAVRRSGSPGWRRGWPSRRQARLLFMHHPPFECGIDAFDHARLQEGDARLAEMVRRHGNVERVMCGHVHRPIQVRWAGTMASIAPSTAHQATLDLRAGAPLSMTMEPPESRCINGGRNRPGDACELRRRLRRATAVSLTTPSPPTALWQGSVNPTGEGHLDAPPIPQPRI